MGRLIQETRAQRAMPALLVSAMVPGGRSAAGSRLRTGLEQHIRGLIEVRVPGVPPEIRDRTAEVVVTLVHLVLAAASDPVDDDTHREELTDEYIDVMLAYLEAKFPSPDHGGGGGADEEERPIDEIAQLPESELGAIFAGEPAMVLLAAPGGEQIARWETARRPTGPRPRSAQGRPRDRPMPARPTSCRACTPRSS